MPPQAHKERGTRTCAQGRAVMAAAGAAYRREWALKLQMEEDPTLKAVVEVPYPLTRFFTSHTHELQVAMWGVPWTTYVAWSNAKSLEVGDKTLP